jgi:hypothetical protein
MTQKQYALEWVFIVYDVRTVMVPMLEVFERLILLSFGLLDVLMRVFLER